MGGASSVSGREAFRWTSTGGLIGIGDLSGGSFESEAWGVSSDGQVIVGHGSSSSGLEAFRWTQGGGMIGLGDLSGGNFLSGARGVSSDGAVVVGFSSSTSSWESYEDFTEAFRWTNNGGMVGLGDLPGGNFDSWATAVSSDGQVIVGAGSSAASFASSEWAKEALLWTSDGSMVGLGDLPGGYFDSTAAAVSSDGSAVVGWSSTDEGPEAFIWDSIHGMRNLKGVLVNQCGLNLTGWMLRDATGISADGLTIVGVGSSPNGDTEAWIATIPEPATILLLGLGGLVLRKRNLD